MSSLLDSQDYLRLLLRGCLMMNPLVFWHLSEKTPLDFRLRCPATSE
jgi:hypothetical protein